MRAGCDCGGGLGRPGQAGGGIKGGAAGFGFGQFGAGAVEAMEGAEFVLNVGAVEVGCELGGCEAEEVAEADGGVGGVGERDGEEVGRRIGWCFGVCFGRHAGIVADGVGGTRAACG